MRQVWLRTNSRLLLLGMILPAVLIAIGLIAALAVPPEHAWLRAGGWIIAGLGAVLLAVVAIQMRTPRVAYADGQLFFFLRSGPPLAMPVEHVECCFLGSGAGQIPGAEGQAIPLKNLVFRVAERALDYQHCDVKPTLGRWENGYITIHGAWCEPLTLEVAKHINELLAEARQSLIPNHATK